MNKKGQALGAELGYWGRFVGAVTGLFVGGPPGAAVGGLFGHALDKGFLRNFSLNRALPYGPLRLAALTGNKEQVFSLAVISLAAKLARVDAPVNRKEIDAFKLSFKIPDETARDVGQLFDHARQTPDDYAPYAKQLAESFADHEGVREDVLHALFTIARADGPINQAELEFLTKVATLLQLDASVWNRIRGSDFARNRNGAEDPYMVLGIARTAKDDQIRAAWKKLMREHHPDSLASRGVPAHFIASATAKVARINAAWDQIKRERKL